MDIRVCIGSSCHLKGSREVINTLTELIKANELEGLVELKGSFCMGKCSCTGIAVKCNDVVHSIIPDQVETFFKESVLPCIKTAI